MAIFRKSGRAHVQTLKKKGDIPGITKELKNQNSKVRRAAVRALSEVGKDKNNIQEFLFEALKDSDFSVRSEAGAALEGLARGPWQREGAFCDNCMRTLKSPQGFIVFPRNGNALYLVCQNCYETSYILTNSSNLAKKRAFGWWRGDRLWTPQELSGLWTPPSLDKVGDGQLSNLSKNWRCPHCQSILLKPSYERMMEILRNNEKIRGDAICPACHGYCSQSYVYAGMHDVQGE